METKDLESKVWFRFLKVVFVFVYIATLILVVLFAYSLKPYTTIDNDNSFIVCINGTKYNAGANGIDAFEAEAERLGATQVYTNGFVPDTTAKEKANELCLGTNTLGRGLFADVPQYTVELANKTVGNWWSFAGYTALALFIVIVVFELIKRSFFYIAIGRKFFSRHQRKT